MNWLFVHLGKFCDLALQHNVNVNGKDTYKVRSIDGIADVSIKTYRHLIAIHAHFVRGLDRDAD